MTDIIVRRAVHFIPNLSALLNILCCLEKVSDSIRCRLFAISKKLSFSYLLRSPKNYHFHIHICIWYKYEYLRNIRTWGREGLFVARLKAHLQQIIKQNAPPSLSAVISGNVNHRARAVLWRWIVWSENLPWSPWSMARAKKTCFWGLRYISEGINGILAFSRAGRGKWFKTVADWWGNE